MEAKIRPHAHQEKSFKALVGKSEKKCNKCGFVTYSLHVLYNHKHKCQGQLLGKPIFCSYCKRKFNFLTLYRIHKPTCVKKALRKNLLKCKLKQKHLKYRKKSVQTPSYSFSCPICHTSFESKQKFVTHLKEQSCTSQQPTKKSSFSARKSFNNAKRSKVSSINDKETSYSSRSKSEKSHHASSKEFFCTYCKDKYPSEKLLFMHLGMNEECAAFYHQTHMSSISNKPSLKARKTIRVVARKSFPHKQRIIEEDFYPKKAIKRSARKSLSSPASKKGYSVSKRDLNQCPVCYEDFPDTYSFFKHQKMMNHWGKATKSFNNNFKCPFCGKDFIQLKSRNAHVKNHSDRSEREIQNFFKSCVCKLCSQIFASASAVEQHRKIAHKKYDWFNRSGTGSEYNTNSDNEYTSEQKMSSVPSAVKKKLKQQPNSCPVCSKAFSHTVLRNKHFNEVHLKIFECQYCNTKFKSTSSLFNHIQLSHGKNFECKECKENFVNELQLLQHVLKYHPDQNNKLLASSKSPKNSVIQEKMPDQDNEVIVRYINKMDFNNELPKRTMEYYCDVCDIGYQKLCGLQRHRQSKFHKDTLEKNIDDFHKSNSGLPPPTPSHPRVVKQPEILTCSECSADFTNIKDFVPHRLSHFSVQGKYLKINELNPYMCEICSDVLDSHSKVQLHLFWHLQVESTSTKSLNTVSKKTEKIVPDRLSGQHVAKKSFSKSSNEALQEVVIGGVKKSLFTCEACKVGFTTKVHYDMHVRKLCKKIKSKKNSENMNVGLDQSNRKIMEAKISKVPYCNSCNCLFSTPAKYDQHKQFCVKCIYDENSEENLSNCDAIKSALKLDTAVAGCITCAALFEDIASLTGHLIVHQTKDVLLSDAVMEDVMHCALCNCLFMLQAFKQHREFCKIPINIGSKSSTVKHINVLKSALELKCAVAACISCGEPFEDLESFSKHLTLHQTDQIQNEVADESLFNGDPADNIKSFESESNPVDNSSDFLMGDLVDSMEIGNNSNSNSNVKSTEKPSGDDNNSLMKTVNHTSHLSDLRKNSAETEDNETKELRKNFSELLCILISDTELMQKLGYGKKMVDDVLVNVLKQMGQVPCKENIPKIHRFRKNIQIFLDLVLKDQVMQVIGKGKTTDEMVIEALKIFASDGNMQNDED